MILALNSGRLGPIEDAADELRTANSYFARSPHALRLLLSGDTTGAIEALPPVSMVGGVPGFVAGIHSLRAHVFASAGLEAEARVESDSWRETVETMGLPAQAMPVLAPFRNALHCISGPPVALLDDRVARWMYRALTEDPGATVQSHSDYLFRGLDTLRGELALRFDELDSAERWFRHGIDFGRKWDLMLEVGCCLQGLADVAERRGNHLEAMQHLDAAGEIYAKHGVKLYLDQVLAKKQLLKA
jgi:hypothetical protein